MATRFQPTPEPAAPGQSSERAATPTSGARRPAGATRAKGATRAPAPAKASPAPAAARKAAPAPTAAKKAAPAPAKTSPAPAAAVDPDLTASVPVPGAGTGQDVGTPTAPGRIRALPGRKKRPQPPTAAPRPVRTPGLAPAAPLAPVPTDQEPAPVAPAAPAAAAAPAAFGTVTPITAAPGAVQQAAPARGGVPGLGGSPRHASWWRRVVATLMDTLLTLPLLIPALVATAVAGGSGPEPNACVPGADELTCDPLASPGNPGLALFGLGAAVLLMLALLALTLWNTVWRQGRTGQSLGKKWAGLRLVDEGTGEHPGAGKALLRSLAHTLDALPLYLGFLLPLIDGRKQTIADKVVKTVVLDERLP